MSSIKRLRVKRPLADTVAVVGGLVILAGVWWTGSNGRQDLHRALQQRAATNERDSEQRSVNNCRRANPTRAYFRLRAQEFTRTTIQRSSYTTRISPQVLAILDCRETVRRGGNPVPLPPGVQRRYLRDFRRGQVDITRGQVIVGHVTFARYFAGDGPETP